MKKIKKIAIRKSSAPVIVVRTPIRRDGPTGYAPGAPRLDPREAGSGPSPKLVLSVPSGMKERLLVIAVAREVSLSVVVREALEEKAAKEERRLGI